MREPSENDYAVTHPDKTHLDDALGGVIVEDRFPGLEIRRTRNEDEVREAFLAFDVSFQYDPNTYRFDHHQGGLDPRDNGIGYAASGLLWKEFGEHYVRKQAAEYRIIPSAIVDEVDRKLIQAADAIDLGDMKGAPITKSGGERLTLPSIHLMIEQMAPSGTLREESSSSVFDEIYERAKALAKISLDMAVKDACISLLVGNRITPQLVGQEDDKILVLDENCEWERYVPDNLPEVFFVVVPNRNKSQYAVRAVSEPGESFMNKLLLPLAWRGKQADDFNQAAGIEDGVFCHDLGFIAKTRSRESAIRLAKKALSGR